MGNADPLARRTREIGERLFALASGSQPSLFDPRSLRGYLLRRATDDPGLRSALFRFVDVLPVLDDGEDIARHFRGYLLPWAEHAKGWLAPLVGLGSRRFTAGMVRRSVIELARSFVAEETRESLGDVVRALRRIPAAVTVDAVGEAVLSEAEADAYRDRYLRLIDLLSAFRDAGLSPDVHVSLKLSALTARFDPLDAEGVRRRAFPRLEAILAKLGQVGGTVTFDMEQFEHKPLILWLFRETIEGLKPTGWQPGVALQGYLKDTERDLRDLIAWARGSGQRIHVRLVKGAYWDTEVALARQRGWPVPVFLDKAATDAHYERLTGLLFEHADVVFPAIASHNLRSLARAAAAAEARGLPPEAWEVQMLYGMAEPLRRAVTTCGLKLRVYLPMGALIPGMAYLIRRLLENTADTSILRQTYVEGADLGQILAAPVPRVSPEAPGPAFANVPLRDFSDREVQMNFARALAAVRGCLGRTYPLTAPGIAPHGAGLRSSRNPACPDEVLGTVAEADVSHGERAVRNAVESFPAWRDTPVDERVRLCRKAAEILEARRDELSAWEVLEVGKNWREADADVAEAVDYLRYYALHMEALSGWRPTVSFPAESNHLRYEPRGVAVIIPPWNFPLAILTGMTAAALVAGNTVIMKPASPAVLVAQQFHATLRQAGFPPGVCQVLPGSGATLGNYLVNHPAVDIIAFTGSREVGLEILRQAHAPTPEQGHLKQVVCEMGGKNAIVVDEDADLDEAVSHTLQSAFGYQGQKCSAASRVIAVGRVHDRLLERLVAALASHEYGPPEDPAFLFGPLISQEAREKALGYITIGRGEGRLCYLGRVPDSGWYAPPAIFSEIQPHHRLAREEIFGPVLAVLRAPSFDAALAMALDSDYALTGGVFSRLPEHLALAQARFRVGNLYLNRGITGARVGVQPFGGTRLSGTGVQAGGPDYLKQFLWTRVVSENTLRHGFVPPAATERNA